MKKILKSLYYFLLPNQCVLCHCNAQTEIPLCLKCETRLQADNFATLCCRCGHLIPDATQICGQCQIKPPHYQRLITGYSYQFPVDHCVTQLKFNQQLVMANILAYLLAKQIKKNYLADTWPDFLLPVPLHHTRLRQRGFNQANVIAKCLKKYLPIRIYQNACQKIKFTIPQSELTAKHRRKNLQNAFSSQQDFSNLHLAIVDDVVTTGATVEEISKLLLKNGARRVDVWTATRVR